MTVYENEILRKVIASLDGCDLYTGMLPVSDSLFRETESRSEYQYTLWVYITNRLVYCVQRKLSIGVRCGCSYQPNGNTYWKPNILISFFSSTTFFDVLIYLSFRRVLYVYIHKKIEADVLL